MSMRVASIGALVVALAIASGMTTSSPTAARAAQQTPGQQPQSNMQEMTKMHEQMMAEMKAGEAKLDALVKEMNSATGAAKTDAIAAVVNELVRQHTSMHGRMGQMHEQMMGGRGMMMKR
jgi:hypothetical protein